MIKERESNTKYCHCENDARNRRNLYKDAAKFHNKIYPHDRVPEWKNLHIVLRTLLTLDLLKGDFARNHTIKEYNFSGSQFLTKKLCIAGGDFLNFFMKIIVICQFYCLDSETL